MEKALPCPDRSVTRVDRQGANGSNKRLLLQELSIGGVLDMEGRRQNSHEMQGRNVKEFPSAGSGARDSQVFLNAPSEAIKARGTDDPPWGWGGEARWGVSRIEEVDTVTYPSPPRGPCDYLLPGVHRWQVAHPTRCVPHVPSIVSLYVWR